MPARLAGRRIPFPVPRGAAGGVTAFTTETIADFNGAEGDRIDLSLMEGSDSFVFNGAGAFSRRGNGEIRVAGGFVQVDADGSGSADLIIE